MPSIIQFFHPGLEHKYNFTNKDNQHIRTWNLDGHRRKFMIHDGQYIENNIRKSSKLLFWCEWEPPSIVERLPQHGRTLTKKAYPEYLHYPFLPPVEKIKEYQKSGYQNTDPFIFGDAFRYSNCKQATYSSLKKLEKGSLILFGSRVNYRFAIDTVFVVKESEPYIASLNDKFENLGIFNQIVLKMFKNSKCNNSKAEKVLYTGATYDKKVNSMFSFVPSIKFEGEKTGFPRVIMPDEFYNEKFSKFHKYFSRWSLENGNITEKASRGIKATHNASIDEIRCFWEYLRDVTTENYVLGVSFKIPENKNITTNDKKAAFCPKKGIKQNCTDQLKRPCM